MNAIEKQRERIDAIDAQLVELFSERFNAARVIGSAKHRHGKPIRNAAREKHVMRTFTTHAKRQGLQPENVERIARDLFVESCNVQAHAPLSASFQGERGAYSEQATRTMLGECGIVPCATVSQALDALQNEEVDVAVIPIENALEGPVTALHDELAHRPLHVLGELDLLIRHALMALPGTRLSDVREVLSHPQALGQCREWLATHVPDAKVTSFYDTAGAAKTIAREQRQGVAAIASVQAAATYGLGVLNVPVGDRKDNQTRFWALCKPKDANRFAVPHAHPTEKLQWRTSVAFGLQNKPGTLVKALSTLANRGANVTRIDSRPSKRKPWEYVFFADLDGRDDSPSLRDALPALKKNTTFLVKLGTYPVLQKTTIRLKTKK